MNETKMKKMVLEHDSMTAGSSSSTSFDEAFFVCVSTPLKWNINGNTNHVVSHFSFFPTTLSVQPRGDVPVAASEDRLESLKTERPIRAERRMKGRKGGEGKIIMASQNRKAFIFISALEFEKPA